MKLQTNDDEKYWLVKSPSSGVGKVPAVVCRMSPASKQNIDQAESIEQKRKDLLEKSQHTTDKMNYLKALHKYNITCKSILSLDLDDVSISVFFTHNLLNSFYQNASC